MEESESSWGGVYLYIYSKFDTTDLTKHKYEYKEEGQSYWHAVYMYKLSVFDTMYNCTSMSTKAILADRRGGSIPPTLADFWYNNC